MQVKVCIDDLKGGQILKVTMFFTFWGLNILRKHEKVRVEKGFVDKMFGIMMPRGGRRFKYKFIYIIISSMVRHAAFMIFRFDL